MDLTKKIWQAFEKYIEDRTHAWSTSTFNSEYPRLKKIVYALEKSGMSGPEFHSQLKAEGYKDYTIKTMFVRAADFYKFAQEQGFYSSFNNPFADHMKRASRQFKNSYKKEKIKITFDEAKARIEKMQDTDVKEFCLQLINSGLRIHEAYKVDSTTGTVVGKGFKERATSFEYSRQLPGQSRVRRALKEVGLKPHTLRKLLATHLARAGMSHADIMYVFGWSNISTAESYFQPMREEELKKKLKEMTK